MIWFILAFLAGLFMFFYLRKDNWETFHSRMRAGIVVWAIGSGVAAMLNFFVGLALPQKSVEWANFPLHSLHDKQGTNGSFFLGTGSVGTQPYYFCYFDLGNGTYAPKQFPVNNNGIWVIENDNNYAHYTEWCRMPKWKYYWLIGFDLYDNQVSWQRFDIPRGSVDNTFSLGK
jgi:hypothetical protein